MRIGRPPEPTEPYCLSSIFITATYGVRALNYKKIHDSIILKAKNREKPQEYCERHHVVPKSMGGTDDQDNLVLLTAREHFIIHWLLFKIHRNRQMTYAFHCMTKPVGNGRERYTSHSFKYAKEAMAEWMSKNNSGKNHPQYGLTGENHPHFGMKRGEAARKNISKAAKKRYKTEVHPTSVKIMCVDTGIVFNSVSEAKKKHPIGNISYALRTGRTAGGKRFAYIDKETNMPIFKQQPKNRYVKGITHKSSVEIHDENGNVFHSAREAGKSIGATGAAVLIAIKQDRPCKGVAFFRKDK